MPRMTKQARVATERLIYHMWLEHAETLVDVGFFEADIPDAWHTIEADLDVTEPKTKLTIYVDKSVADTFRKMGRGFHARINRILQSWIQAKLAGVLERNPHLRKHREMAQVEANLMAKEADLEAFADRLTTQAQLMEDAISRLLGEPPEEAAAQADVDQGGAGPGGVRSGTGEHEEGTP